MQKARVSPSAFLTLVTVVHRKSIEHTTVHWASCTCSTAGQHQPAMPEQDNSSGIMRQFCGLFGQWTPEAYMGWCVGVGSRFLLSAVSEFTLRLTDNFDKSRVMTFLMLGDNRTVYTPTSKHAHAHTLSTSHEAPPPPPTQPRPLTYLQSKSALRSRQGNH